jgi:chloride channel 2
MKSILSGVVLPRYLSFRTFLAKITGLVFAIAGGLSIGMEGPFVHLSAIIANQLTKAKIFQRIRKNEALRFQMLSAGCAVGISTIFGAPIGGVLFAIEKTTTYVLIQNIWKSLFAATVGALIAKFGGTSGLFAKFATSLPADPFSLWELLIYTFIGIVFGYLGGMWVRLVLKLVLLRRDYKILSNTFVFYIYESLLSQNS